MSLFIDSPLTACTQLCLQCIVCLQMEAYRVYPENYYGVRHNERAMYEFTIENLSYSGGGDKKRHGDGEVCMRVCMYE